MLTIVLPVFALVSVQWGPLQAVISAHDKLKQGAVHVSVDVNSKEKVHYAYDLYFIKGSKFRLDWKDSKGRLIIVADKNGIYGYDPAGNRYVYRRTTDLEGTFSTLYMVFDVAEPLLPAYLAKAGGVQAFLEFFGKRTYTKQPGGKYVSEKSPKLELITDPATNLIKRMTMFGANGVKGLWVVSKTPLTLDTALKFQLPRGARRVESLGPEGQPPSYATPEAKGIVQKSRQAYASLTTVRFTTTGYLFPGNKERHRKTETVWIHQGKFLYTSGETAPEAHVRVLYESGKLLAWKVGASKLYASVCSVTRIPSKLVAASFDTDMLTSSILRDENFWDKLVVNGSKVKLLADRAMLSRNWCRVIEARSSNGWVSRIYLSETSNLVLRLERKLEADGKPVYSETIVYEYQTVGLPILEKEWSLTPPNIPTTPFPGDGE